MKRLIFLTFFLITVIFSGCSEKKPVTASEAKIMADRRFAAHSQMLKGSESPVPIPTIEDRGTDFLFVYIETATKKKIFVIVEKSGEIADGVESL